MKKAFGFGIDEYIYYGAYPGAAALIHDAGNTTTLAHYLELLSMAGLVSGLQKFSANTLRKRLSIPKLQVQNTALSNRL